MSKKTATDDLREIVPPLLMALGAISLFRGSRALGLALVGTWLYDLACRSDSEHEAQRRAANAQIDTEIEDSFPASDPPSFSGSTAGAP